MNKLGLLIDFLPIPVSSLLVVQRAFPLRHFLRPPGSRRPVFVFSFIHQVLLMGEAAIDSVNNAADPPTKATQTRITQTASQFKRWGRRNPFVRYGLPLISLTVLGSIGLGHMLEGRQNVRKEKDDLEWEALENTKLLARTGPMDGYKPNKNFSLENELKMLQEKIDIYNYEYKKIPRLDGSGSKPDSNNQ